MKTGLKIRISSILICLFILWFLPISYVFGYVKVKEDSGSDLDTTTKKIENHEQQNLDHDKEREKQLEKGWDKDEISKRETAFLMLQFATLKSHENLLQNADGSSMDFNNHQTDELSGQGEGKYADYVMKTVDFAQEYVDSTGKIKVAVWDSPKWESLLQPPSTSFNSRTQKLIMKVSAKYQYNLTKNLRTERIQNLVCNIANGLLPDQIIKSFDSKKLATYLRVKAGITELADGIFSRPTASQDLAFAKYANLGCGETDEILFWSDKIVADGYHPTLGTALNKTLLSGAKQLDMDNIVSRGYSSGIDKWNLLQPVSERVQNPFRGYASRVVPGLLVMSEEGRLTPGKAPNDAQLAEAMKISKKIHMLPSENMKLQKNISFCFRYPPRIILVAGESSSGSSGTTTIIGLAKLDEDVFKNRMEMIKTRLKEIAKLKRENRLARKYADKVLQSDIQMQQEAQNLWQRVSDMTIGNPAKSPDYAFAIPQLTQLRKDIESSVEKYRDFLSNLEMEHDKLLQKEWVVLERALETKRAAIRKLMDNASIRYRTTVNPDESPPSGDQT